VALEAGGDDLAMVGWCCRLWAAVIYEALTRAFVGKVKFGKIEVGLKRIPWNRAESHQISQDQNAIMPNFARPKCNHAKFGKIEVRLSH
jgi:hypothetical protein